MTDATTSESPRSEPGPGSRRGLVALTAAGVLWGTIGVSVRLLQDSGMSSWAIAFWRFVCAALVLAAVLRPARLVAVARQLRHPARPLAVAGAGLVFQLLYFFSVRNIGAGVATLVALGLAPVVVHVSEAVASRSAPSPRTLAILGLALGGLAVVTTGSLDPTVAPNPALGLIQALGCGLAYATSTIWTRPLLSRLAPLPITLVTSVFGAVILLPILAVVGWQVPRELHTVTGVVWLGVVTTVLAYGLFYFGLGLLPGSIALILTLLEPVTAFVFAAVLLGEPLTFNKVAGGMLILLAVAALYLRPRSGTPPDLT